MVGQGSVIYRMISVDMRILGKINCSNETIKNLNNVIISSYSVAEFHYHINIVR